MTEKVEWVHWCKDIPLPVHVYTDRCNNCGMKQTRPRRNRYSTVPPYKWYGPDPEPTPSTINEHRRLMVLRHTYEKPTWITEWDIDANLPLYTRDYLKGDAKAVVEIWLRNLIGYKIGDRIYAPEEVTIIRREKS